MKWTDKAIEAAATSLFGSYDVEKEWVEEALTAASAAQFQSEDHKALKKAWLCYHLCEGGGAYDGPFFVKYEPEKGDYDKIEPILYYDAAQFQSEDYAGLLKELRNWGAMNYKICNDAADAIETLLAELNSKPKPSEEYAGLIERLRREPQKDVAGHKSDACLSADVLEALQSERDALLARLAPKVTK